MSLPDEYALLDFGGGRKLERFGALVLDRPSPAAEGIAPADPDLWPRAHARFERSSPDQGTWHPPRALPKAWTVRHGELVFELKPTPFGHVGLFPEQAENWDWIGKQLPAVHARHVAAADLHGEGGRRCKLLNLFAHTGGSTLAAAAAGAEVVHVDAARNVVDWARRNAALSGLADAPIRWIVEDAPKFVAREVRRGNRYDAIILDPPSYGRGPQGQEWKLDRDLPELLRGCAELTGGEPRLLLLTCHAADLDRPRLRAVCQAAGFRDSAATIDSGELCLTTADGRKLPCGAVLRATG